MLRRVIETIQTLANERKWRDCLQALDQLLPKLADICAEFTSQNGAAQANDTTPVGTTVGSPDAQLSHGSPIESNENSQAISPHAQSGRISDHAAGGVNGESIEATLKQPPQEQSEDEALRQMHERNARPQQQNEERLARCELQAQELRDQGLEVEVRHGEDGSCMVIGEAEMPNSPEEAPPAVREAMETAENQQQAQSESGGPSGAADTEPSQDSAAEPTTPSTDQICPPTSADQTGSVSYLVTDNVSDEAIETASVTIGEQTIERSSFGCFVLPPGNYPYNVTAEGYQTDSGTVTVTAGEDIDLQVTLTPAEPTTPPTDRNCPPTSTDETGSVTFAIDDAVTGAAIEGAQITVAGETLQSGNIGAGAFLNVPTASQLYSVTAEGYQTVSGTVTVTAGEDTDLQITLAPTEPTTPATDENTEGDGGDDRGEHNDSGGDETAHEPVRVQNRGLRRRMQVTSDFSSFRRDIIAWVRGEVVSSRAEGLVDASNLLEVHQQIGIDHGPREVQVIALLQAAAHGYSYESVEFSVQQSEEVNNQRTTDQSYEPPGIMTRAEADRLANEIRIRMDEARVLNQRVRGYVNAPNVDPQQLEQDRQRAETLIREIRERFQHLPINDEPPEIRAEREELSRASERVINELESSIRMLSVDPSSPPDWWPATLSQRVWANVARGDDGVFRFENTAHGGRAAWVIWVENGEIEGYAEKPEDPEWWRQQAGGDDHVAQWIARHGPETARNFNQFMRQNVGPGSPPSLARRQFERMIDRQYRHAFMMARG